MTRPRTAKTEGRAKTARPWNHVGRLQLAQLMGVHADRITHYRQQGMPVLRAGGRGRESVYDAVACLKWQRDQTGRNGAQADRARRDRAQALLAEQAYQLRAGELLPRDQVFEMWAGEYAALRTALLALPQLLADKLAKAHDQAGIDGLEAELTMGIRTALTGLSDPDRPLPPRVGIQ